MSNHPLKLISPERVKTLLDCYGADPVKWPKDERSAALALLHQSDELSQRQLDAKRLDDLLQPTSDELLLSETDSATLVSHIVENLPRQIAATDTLRNSPHRLWSMATAAAILLTATPVYLYLHHIQSNQPLEQLASANYEQWLWEDITGDTITKDDEPLDFMTLVELEQPDP